MKKLFIAGALLLGITIQAQGNEFTYTLEKTTRDYSDGWTTGMKAYYVVPNDYVVIEREATSSQLHDMVLDWIKKTYVDPDQVIKVNDSDYIRMRAHTGGYYGSYYVVEFRFKNNKIQVKTDYLGARPLIKLKSNGKKKQIKYAKEGADNALAYMNKIVLSIKAHELVEEIKSDW